MRRTNATIYLDCNALTRGSRFGKMMFPRLRQYFRSRFRERTESMDEKAILRVAYLKYNGGKDDPLIDDRISKDYAAWQSGASAPDYACSWLRTALSDREHSPHYERFRRLKAA
jgi:hypothetical protein